MERSPAPYRWRWAGMGGFRSFAIPAGTCHVRRRRKGGKEGAACRRARMRLVTFQNSPFPVRRRNPREGRALPRRDRGRAPLATTSRSGKRLLAGTRPTRTGACLLALPRGFNPNKPILMGSCSSTANGATLEARCARTPAGPCGRCSIPAATTVLVAPQFAFDALDSSAGAVSGRPGAFRAFLDEAAGRGSAQMGGAATAI